MTTTKTESPNKELYLVGSSISHSVAPALHTFIAKQLGLPWIYSFKDFHSLEECLQSLRTLRCAGAAITMPWKSSIIPFLDEVDESVKVMGACNTVRSEPDGRLAGCNTDWVGVAGALREHEERMAWRDMKGLIIGAGGAARAAIYALNRSLDVKEIYIINRDKQEVLELQREVESKYSPPPQLIHITAAKQTAPIEGPLYAVGTIPDFEPRTKEEIEVKNLLAQVLQHGILNSVLVDMCYKPRRTRQIRMAEEAGWKTVEGWHVVGHQAEKQWVVWAGEENARRLHEMRSEYWKVLREEADRNPEINDTARSRQL